MHSTATVDTSLGRFTLTADENGLCRLFFPEEVDAAEPEQMVDIGSHALLAEAAGQLQAYLAGSLRDFDLPLSIQGTTFQQQVWQQLRMIPYGETMSYGELAQQVGGRHKARAVGGAAHNNPVALIIPCHRLIGANGSLTGFGGGLAMKQALLQLEGITVQNLKKII